MSYNYESVVKVEKLPKEKHFAVLEETSVSGDDGWGNSVTTNYLKYLTFKDAAELQTWVEFIEAANSRGGYGGHTTYKVIEATPLEIKKTLTIHIK